MPETALEYVIRLRDAAQAANEARHVAESVDKVGVAAARVTRESSAGSAAAGRFAASMERLSRFSQQSSSTLRAAGATAESAATKFTTAIRRMRDAAARPIRIIAGTVGHLTPSLGSSRAEAKGVSVPGAGILGGVAGKASGALFGGLLALGSAKGIMDTTHGLEELVIQATALHKVTGISLNTAAQWLAITEAHGIANKTLTMSFRTLSTQVEGALGKSSKAKDAFKALGITEQDLKAHGNDVSAVVGLVADKFNAMHGGVQKTAIAAQLFGRGWQKLIPILSEGSKGMEEQRKLAAAYGITLGKDPVANIKKLHEAQINLKLAQIGLSTQIAEHLAPALLKIVNVGLKVWAFIRQNMGPVFKWVGGIIQQVSGWIRSHGALWQRIGGIFAAAWRAIKNAAVGAWGALKGIFNALVSAAHWVGGAFNWLAHNVFAPAWKVIRANAQVAWALISPIFNLMIGLIQRVGSMISWAFQHIAKPAFSTLGDIISAAWKVAGPVLSTMLSVFTAIAQAVWWVVQRISSLASTIGNFVKNIANWLNPLNALSSAFSSISSLFGGVQSAGGIAPGITPGTSGLPGVSSPGGGGTSSNPNSGALGTPPIVHIRRRTGQITAALATGRGLALHATFDHPIIIDGHEIARVQRRQTIKAMAAGA